MNWKKIMALSLCGAVTLSFTACRQSSTKDKSTTQITSAATSKEMTTTQEETTASADLSQLKLGEDHTDLKAELKVLTNRTDLVDKRFQKYIKEFRKLYPGIKITYEAVNDYEKAMQSRLADKKWGSICMIPESLGQKNLGKYFVALGSAADLEEQYRLLTNFTNNKKVYGIPSAIQVQGVVYNKSVFEKAGISQMPKTPDEFLAALEQIKKKTKTIPLYTNYASSWAMAEWDDYIGPTATGDGAYMSDTICHTKDPFAKRGDGTTGPYAVYDILYRAAAGKLIESHPEKSNWKQSKKLLHNGKTGCMVLGSWAVKEIKAAGKHPENIGYMPFPITVEGRQYTLAQADYAYGINKNLSKKEQLAAKIYVKWLLERSGYEDKEGLIPADKSVKWPEAYESMQQVTLLEAQSAQPGEEKLLQNINTTSKVGLGTKKSRSREIIAAARKEAKPLDQIMADWNKKWTKAQQVYDALTE